MTDVQPSEKSSCSDVQQSNVIPFKTGNRRPREIPKSTVNMRKFGRRRLAMYNEPDVEGFMKPSMRADCVQCKHCQAWRDGDRDEALLICGHDVDTAIRRSRPCVMVSCSQNTYLDTTRDDQSIIFNFPDLEPDEMPARRSCVLDIAEREGMTLNVAGAIMNMTRERVRQLITVALERAFKRLEPWERQELIDLLEGRRNRETIFEQMEDYAMSETSAPTRMKDLDETIAEEDLSDAEMAEIDGWTNEVLAHVRSGHRLAEAVDLANQDPGPVSPLGPWTEAEA